MLKKIIYTMIILLNLFLSYQVNAECTYKEKESLLNEASEIKIEVIPQSTEQTTSYISEGTKEEELYTYEKYSFDFTIYNLAENLYIKYYNDFDETEGYIRSNQMTDGKYIITDDNEDTIKNYYFEIRANTDTCAGTLLKTEKRIKPIINYFSNFSICEEEALKNYKYCQKITNEKYTISESDFFKQAYKLIDTDENNLPDSISDTKDNKLIIISSIAGIVLIIGIILLIIKKRKENII